VAQFASHPAEPPNAPANGSPGFSLGTENIGLTKH
jgi:hypothetical protein